MFTQKGIEARVCKYTSVTIYIVIYISWEGVEGVVETVLLLMIKPKQKQLLIPRPANLLGHFYNSCALLLEISN